MNLYIDKYLIEKAYDLGTLMTKVNDSMAGGWQPLGGIVYLGLVNGEHMYGQTLVTYRDADTKICFPAT